MTLIRASWYGTAAFTVSAAVATVVPDAALVALVVALALFATGTVAFVAALTRAAVRSRTEVLTVAGLFFLEGAPPRARRLLLGSLVAEVAVAFATAAIRPNTSLAFGLLAPVYAQGLTGLWAARHGAFPARRTASPPRPRSPQRPGGRVPPAGEGPPRP